MKKALMAFILFYSLALTAQLSLAVTLSLVPSLPVINVHDTSTVDLKIAGLGDFMPPSLGGFLVTVTFDDSILAFDSVLYGAFLGDPSNPAETDIVTTVIVGSKSVSFDEVSLLFDFELDALQPGSFSLATLRFRGIRSGTSTVGYDVIDLSDAVGSTMVDLTFESASIQVVPEPGTVLLLSSGLVGLMLWQRKVRIKLASQLGITLFLCLGHSARTTCERRST